MKVKFLLAFFTIAIFTNCAREAVALNEYHPNSNTKISSVSAEVTAQDIKEVQARKRAYYK
jgi:hypothetical protein